MTDLSFTAIDFETMTAKRTSACAIGVVRVVSNVIVQKFYSLLKPIPDDSTNYNTDINNITPAMVASAPTFADIWPIVKPLIESNVLVAHNTEFDISILNHLVDYYNLNVKYKDPIDTYHITKMSLDASCKMANISLDNHHDALCDATACALLLLNHNGISIVPKRPIRKGKPSDEYAKVTKLSSEVKIPLPKDMVKRKDTPFYNKKIVITGILKAFPLREKLGDLLKLYGADINTSISCKTNIVIAGNEAGPSKLNKIDEINNSNKGNIVIYDEKSLLNLFDKYQIDISQNE